MYQYKAKILKVLDGDTVDIDLDLGFNIILSNQRVRMAGIDTPESRTVDKEEKIRGTLSKKKLADTIRSVIYFVGEDKKDVGVKGQTIIANDKYAFILEMTSKHLPVIDKIQPDKTIVRTNHGIEYPDTGYTSGDKRESSLSRMSIAKQKIEQVKSADEVLDALSAQYTKDSFMNPYRRDNKYDMHTTSQVMYNLSKLELHLRWDIDYSEFKEYVNRLPKGYKPKIKITVSKTD